MRFKIKNFIAFSLAEMMIVLLIVSVISAATIPTISTRVTSNKDLQKEKDGTSDVVSVGLAKELATSGIFYRNTSKTDKFIIGVDTSTYTASDKSNSKKAMGYVAFAINPISDVALANYGQIVTYQNSTLGTDNFNSYVKTGSIAMDSETGYGNIRIGLNPQFANFSNLRDSIFIGKYAGADSGSGLSFSDGHNSLGYSKSYLRNISIGSYASYNVANSGAKSVKIHDTVNIGRYAGSDMYYGISVVNIGTYAGTSSANTPFVLYEGNINSGYYAGAYNFVTTGNSYYANTNNISIGTYAAYGSRAADTTEKSLQNNRINIGNYAGFKNNYANSVHIGYYAGALLGSQKGTDFSGTVALGDYAGAIFNSASIDYGKHQSAVLIGRYAGTNSTYFGNSVAIGSYAIYGSAPTSYSWTGSGADNHMGVAIGYFSGAQIGRASSDSGRYASTFIGTYSGYNIGKGYGNVAIGAYAMANIGTSGNDNYNNVFIGNYAGYGIIHASNTVIIGSQTNAQKHNVANSVLIGDCPKMGNDSTKVEYKSCIVTQSIDASKRINFNSGFTPGATDVSYIQFYTPNKPTLFISPAVPSGGFAKTVITLYATYVFGPNTNMTSYSDRRLKENIRPTEYGVKDLRKINVYEFNMKDNKTEPRIGVIAQEVQSVFPRAVKTSPNGYLTVNADDIFFTSVKAIKELDETVNNLIDELKIQIKNLKSLVARVDKIDDKIKQLAMSNKQLDKKLKEIDMMIGKTEHK